MTNGKCLRWFKFSYTLFSLLLTGALLPKNALAQDNVYEGDVVSLAFVENIFSSLLSMTIRVIGIGIFLMLIVGALKYLFSGGDKEAVSHAKDTITKALMGLTLVFGAWFILLFISKLTGNPSILQFDFIF
jgi:hypothetical protein